jgi:MoaA/NifB/PqqE/SkfB family radical SAM enzyme
MNSWETKDDHALMLTKEERVKFRAQMLKFRAKKSIYIIHSPDDEELLGGCVSAGRGFAHITPQGDLTPCPVSDVATHNLTRASLQEGLASPLFEEIRKNEHLLENEGTPCALFAHPQEVDALARAMGAYRTKGY